MQELQELLRLSLPACLALLPALLKLLPLTYPGRPARAVSGAGRAYLGAGALEPQQLGQVVPRCVVDRVLKHLHLLHQGQVVVVWGHLQQNRHRRESGGSAPGGDEAGVQTSTKRRKDRGILRKYTRDHVSSQGSRGKARIGPADTARTACTSTVRDLPWGFLHVR